MPAGRRDRADLVIEIRVQPRASRSELAGLHGGRLRVRLQAPPVDGRANLALVDFLARVFAVPRAKVVIEHGLGGRDKRVRVRDVGAITAPMQALLGCD